MNNPFQKLYEQYLKEKEIETFFEFLGNLDELEARDLIMALEEKYKVDAEKIKEEKKLINLDRILIGECQIFLLVGR